MTEVHIYRGTNRRYVARVRRRGERRWTVIGKPRTTCKTATLALAKEFISARWHFGEVALLADYYDPVAIVEIKRR